ncbi:HAD family phosphatase [Reinekea sp.]|uniref:HAD family hydrolase n=1 Tax=Reinekea sp. TaxID=1970455 RepID=UPI002A7F1EF9|nr:HAD family phosphatase [Reinekea sp.]
MAIIEAVLWDMDGVLLDSERLVRDVFSQVMTEQGVMVNPAERYLETIGLNHQGIVQWYLQFVDTIELAEHYCSLVGALYMRRASTELQLKAGVVEALNSVAELAVPQMVVTSSPSLRARQKLAQFGLNPYFEHLIGGDQVAQGKPHPEPYLTACAQLSVDPARVLVIEDSANGVASGLAAGCMVLHVPDLIDTDPQWQHSIYHALDSLASFPRWFNMQRGGDWL